uniref:Uncharacterized protein n=1 Tax=Grammatophora oceanica TaxID=210454 RepID=A0A7S1VM44_9STRA|mmetsp:Transcript_50355/g.75268  ORF Transcript_50355/g.75268 Transcript_50355/m.75268 type:complete len:254 (+) Transcript_50355:107-868(+)|eukprot:CAMPEP_0194048848 /NCGR_PEP_ID=MMETSP0009_2-20130614/28751_1 /TAXON_ID=210454 /ORGANISM="Grammatophora oceanica, Strain CCMP 410" /LENGTH=253 /DNA_ID=CAMNT_0038694853 /DNA_START=91 /DNA_END=852 /DNA_ORIENTATION=-
MSTSSASSSFPFEKHLDEEDKVFLLKFSDGHHVPLTVERLKKLVDLLPALPFLLFGHPNMKRKPLKRHPQSGMLVVDFPEICGVGSADFTMIYHFALGLRPISEFTGNRDEFYAMLSYLGGCEYLETALASEDPGPTLPHQDADEQQYLWLVQIKEKYDQPFNLRLSHLAADGWHFTTESEGKLHFRKDKNAVVPGEAANKSDADGERVFKRARYLSHRIVPNILSPASVPRPRREAAARLPGDPEGERIINL